jgi:hypothetical protein
VIGKKVPGTNRLQTVRVRQMDGDKSRSGTHVEPFAVDCEQVELPAPVNGNTHDVILTGYRKDRAPALKPEADDSEQPVEETAEPGSDRERIMAALEAGRATTEELSGRIDPASPAAWVRKLYDGSREKVKRKGAQPRPPRFAGLFDKGADSKLIWRLPTH